MKPETKQQAKYRIVVFNPKWYTLDRTRIVSLEKWDGRSKSYRAVPGSDVGVIDSGPYPKG